MIGAYVAGRRIQSKEVEEELAREAATLIDASGVPWSPDVPPIPAMGEDSYGSNVLPRAAVALGNTLGRSGETVRAAMSAPLPETAAPVVPVETIKVDFLDPAACEGFIKGSFADKPQRLRHILVVADRVRQSARDINELNPGTNIDETKAYCAALVHDIGYLEPLVVKGFHPVDGYLFLARSGFTELASLIVGHSTSPEESELLGFGTLRPSTELIADLITYWDMQVLPGGVIASYEERIQDILRRYGEETPIGQATIKARPRIQGIMERISRLLQLTPQ